MGGRWLLVFVAGALSVSACQSTSRPSTQSPRAASPTSTTAAGVVTHEAPDVAPYAKPGPYSVGINVLEADTGEIDVFYPAPAGAQRGHTRATYDQRAATHDPSGPPLTPDPSQLVTIDAYRDIPVAAGRFPVILFSHGYGAVPLVNAALESRLAAWGFVVIAPDHRDRDTLALITGRATVGDLRDAHTLVHAMNDVAALPRFGPHLDASEVAAIGHSQGGGTALAALTLPQIKTAVAWASTPPAVSPLPDKPVMLIGAAHDLDYGSGLQQNVYRQLHGPRRLVLLGSGAGHATFVDLCQLLWERHTLAPSSAQTILPGNRLAALAENGCHPNEVEPSLAWDAIVHFTVAQLRALFHIDPSPVGLEPVITRAFPKIAITYASS